MPRSRTALERQPIKSRGEPAGFAGRVPSREGMETIPGCPSEKASQPVPPRHLGSVPPEVDEGAAVAPSQPRRRFPIEEYASRVDPAAVKARYQVGPVDPTILFVGDLDERHGPDLLVRALPPILKNHPQARLVIVGDGPLIWPLRVMSRYMLLDYAIRIVGHVGGKEVRELIAAADIVAVPSRERTEDWQILSGWSARRPVVATSIVAEGLCEHEKDGVLVYPNPGSVVWGLERVLFDVQLAHRLGEAGYRTVCERFGDGPVAAPVPSPDGRSEKSGSAE